MKDHVLKLLSLVLFLLAVGMGIFIYITRTSSPVAASAQSDIKSLQDDFSWVADKCSPAVVVIKTGVIRAPYSDTYTQLYNYFHEGRGVPEKPVQTGLGSGFFISATGYILTNYHIVRQQDVFTVIMQDKTEYSAEIVGIDPLSDLAVLKIKPNGVVPFLEFADSEKVKVGHWAIAIGAPFSLEHSVTVGVISHKRRTMGLNVYENFIQTDASINQGNSGGPLLDINGKVIGVNDFIITPSAGSIGLSFAIAGNLAKKIGDELIVGGKIIRPWLGVSMAALSAEQCKQVKISGGVLIVEMLKNGSADRAGLFPGDIILALDDQNVASPNDIQLGLANYRPGDQVKLTIFREGRNMNVTVQVDKLPERLF